MDIQTVIKAIPGVTEPQAEKLCRYYEMLMDWNSRMNLTAITGEDEVLKKHFADSLLPLELIPEGANLIDVGTGAGFPGLPIAIARPDVKVTLLDSLNKRIGFLREVCKELDINADCIHGRAEDGGRNPALREKFDIAVSRAVAKVSPLAEYTVPFVKVGGRSLMYSGSSFLIEYDLEPTRSARRTIGYRSTNTPSRSSRSTSASPTPCRAAMVSAMARNSALSMLR